MRKKIAVFMLIVFCMGYSFLVSNPMLQKYIPEGSRTQAVATAFEDMKKQFNFMDNILEHYSSLMK